MEMQECVHTQKVKVIAFDAHIASRDEKFVRSNNNNKERNVDWFFHIWVATPATHATHQPCT